MSRYILWHFFTVYNCSNSAGSGDLENNPSGSIYRLGQRHQAAALHLAASAHMWPGRSDPGLDTCDGQATDIPVQQLKPLQAKLKAYFRTYLCSGQNHVTPMIANAFFLNPLSSRKKHTLYINSTLKTCSLINIYATNFG